MNNLLLNITIKVIAILAFVSKPFYSFFELMEEAGKAQAKRERELLKLGINPKALDDYHSIL